MNQKRAEIQAFCDLIYNDQSRFILEIGNETGSTLAFLSGFAARTAVLIGVDIALVPAPSLCSSNQRVYMITGDSHSPDTLQAVVETLGEEHLDCLFIDGDHFGARQDFEMYGPLVRKGGIIAFHDIVSGSPQNVGSVPQDWLRIKQGKDTFEIVDSWQQGGWGIGVIRV